MKSYEPTASVNKLLSQNTQDLRKKKSKLNEDEKDSTNNKNEHDRLNNILITINKIDNFFEHKFFSDELKLPKWVKVSEEKFNEILSTVAKAKNKGLKVNVDRKEIMLDNTERLLKDLGN